jgi:cation transport ATPase
MGTGTDVAMESAGVTLLKGDLTGIVRAPGTVARRSMRNIRQNLFFAFVYNAPASRSPPACSTREYCSVPSSPRQP